jgi:protein-disulfide isomerase
LPQQQLAQLEQLPPAQRNQAMVQAAGLDAMFRQRGMPEARINSCLANQAELDKLIGVTNRAANEEGVTGTPTFLINGEIVPNTADWATLEPKLRAAIG